jgi:hypothetical protein
MLRLAVLVLAALAAFPSAAFAVDLTVTGVEVTQATQKPDNSIKLVARRSTAVRATIGVTGSAAAVPGVTGRVHVFRNGTEITPTAGVAPLASLTAPLAPNRAIETDTLNFELPDSALNQLTATTNLDVRVDVTPVAGETNTANNSGAANNLTVVAGVNPKLFFTRINYTPAGLGLPADAFIQPGVGDVFVKGILPVDDRASNLYAQGLFPSLTYTGDADGNGILDALGTDGSALLNLLESCRQLIVDNGLGATETTFLYGWLAGNPIDGNGLAGVGGRTAFGNTDPIRGQRSYAHELTHNFGFNHVTNTIDEVGWDVGARLVDNPSTNNTTGHVKPTNLFDIQVGGQLTNSAWIDTPKYISLLGNTSLGFGSGDTQGDIRKKAKRQVLVIQGQLDRKGVRVLRLEPVFRYPWLTQPSPANASGDYVAEVVTTTGGVIRAPFDGGIHDDRAPDRPAFGSFNVMVPAIGQVASVRIVQRRTKKTLVAIKPSRLAPKLSIASPKPKAKLTKRTTIRWKASDADTARTKLRYQLAYSRDGGRSFVPLGVDVSDSSLTFDATQVRKSKNALIRVFVSDGLNTTFADVGSLQNAVGR